MRLSIRTLDSALWATGANLAVMALVLVRSIFLARLLPVEIFGIYAFAATVSALAAVFSRFGLEGAFLHRTTETEDELKAASVHFSCSLVLGSLTAAGLIGAALLLADGPLRLALIVLAATQFGLHLTVTPQAILRRRVTHRRLAILNIVATLISTIVSLITAFSGGGLWALLAVNITICAATLIFLYGWRPPWRPRLRWDRQAIGYFLHFGIRNVTSDFLQEALRRVDKLYIGFWMPTAALGLFSRAYDYALAPIAVLSRPFGLVVGGTLAELREQPMKLSAAVSRITRLLFHGSCLLAGLTGVVAPELIELLIGEKWLPMVTPFRILLIAFLFNPVTGILSQLAIALGRPGGLMKIRLVQLGALVTTMVLLAPRWHLAGVSIALLVSSYSGLVLLILAFRADVDIAPGSLFAKPLLALLLGIAASLGVATLVTGHAPLWLKIVAEAGAFLTAYLSILWLMERAQLKDVARLMRDYFRTGNISSIT